MRRQVILKMKTRTEFLKSDAVLQAALEIIPAGRKSAVPIKQIVERLEVRIGVLVSRNEFQNRILQELRRQGWFIGGGARGMFLCVTKQDCEEAAQFYRSRIAAETVNLNRCLACQNNLPNEL